MAHTLQVLLGVMTLAFTIADIRVPPTIVEQREEHEVPFRAGIEIILPCVASGTPEPQYEWYRNGDFLELNDVDVTLSSVDGTLTIREAGYPHEGYYQCRAHNDHGTALSNVVYLQRGVLQHTESETAPFSGHVGQSLRVPCSGIHSIPEPVYSWALAQGPTDDNPTPLSLSRRVTMDENGHLYFAYLTDGDRRDGYLYKCNAFNVIKDLTQGGSYSTIEVDTRDPIEEAPPELMYSTPSPHVALIGQETRLKCFFSGRPAPRVSWDSGEGKLLPVGRHTKDAFDTELVISDVQADDEGYYICQGANSLSDGRSEEIRIYLDVQSSPSFDAGWKPENINATEGNDQSFHCKTSAEPGADSQWMINGEPIDPSDPGPRMSVSSDGYTLTINDLCKTCPDGHTDLRVIQCNSSNVHGYAFASAYLNVLVRTQIALAPEDVVYEEGLQEVRFDCEATSDESTPVEISWLKDDSTIYPATDARINITDSNTLVIDLTGMSEDDIRAIYHGEYTCFASNSYTSSTEVAQFNVPGVGPPAAVTAGFGDYWWLLLIIVLLLLIFILILCCCLCFQRNKGDSYPVDEKERANGNDPVKELADTGYHDYQRPVDAGPVKGSRASLASTAKLDSEDDASLSQYGDLEMGRFNEDGSFLGQYDTDKRKRSRTQSQDLSIGQL